MEGNEIYFEDISFMFHECLGLEFSDVSMQFYVTIYCLRVVPYQVKSVNFNNYVSFV